MSKHGESRSCQECGTSSARCFQLFSFGAVGELSEERRVWLCVRCARSERKRLAEKRRQKDDCAPSGGLTRAELMAELESFFAESGVLEICRRCHEQGTGCCPPSCRTLTPSGCAGKNLFCSAFVCSALLNAIAECDADAARVLKWAKSQLGPTEFRVYEMMTRVPRAHREPQQPLILPRSYPGPLGLSDGRAIKSKLLALADEVLETRRRWNEAVEEPSESALTYVS